MREYAEGVVRLSPELARDAYPGISSIAVLTPKGFRGMRPCKGYVGIHNPFQGWKPIGTNTQGSFATLG